MSLLIYKLSDVVLILGDRASNLRMKVLFNAHDRETGEWPELFAKADSRFKVTINKFHNRELNNDVGPTLALVEAVWEG